MATDYPVIITVAPAAPQSRLTIFFRLLMVIPHAFVLYFLQMGVLVVTLLAWFTIIIVGSYPSGMFGFSAKALAWQTRAGGYASLLTGAYPPFALEADNYPIQLTVAPATTGRSRLTTFFRIFMVIPQIVVLYFINLFVGIMTLFAWFAALFTGRVPDGMHGLIAGGLRWQTRVTAYMLLLTDAYPPFSMD